MSPLPRLQKILSEIGVASRRQAEEMIREGRVTVNGRVARIGEKADPLRDHIKVDGRLISRSSVPRFTSWSINRRMSSPRRTTPRGGPRSWTW